jgi:hypothetical protein
MGIGGRALAADDIDEALSGAGKVWYEKYCTPCHGPGGAPGTAAYGDTKEPVDLRSYVARHGGKFPASDWLTLIADARPGNLHTKVWEKIKESQVGVTFNEAAARGVLGSIARYINSVQTK